MSTLSKNYVITNLNDSKLVRALVDTGNSIDEQVAISKQINDQLNIGFKTQEKRKLGQPTRIPNLQD